MKKSIIKLIPEYSNIRKFEHDANIIKYYADNGFLLSCYLEYKSGYVVCMHYNDEYSIDLYIQSINKKNEIVIAEFMTQFFSPRIWERIYKDYQKGIKKWVL